MDGIYSKCRRGQVWFVKNRDFVSTKNNYKDHSSITAKNRPFLIVSNNVNNENSTTLNCVPITTKKQDHLPCHIYYYDSEYSRGDQQIQTEQITTISISDLDHYMFTLSDSIMKRVDAALATQVGVTTGLDIVEDLLEYVDKMIDRKLEILKNAKIQRDNKIVSETALHIKQSLTEMMKDAMKDATEEVSKDENSNQVKINEERNITKLEAPKAEEIQPASKEGDSSESLPINNNASKASRRSNSWTEERMREYLMDYSEKPIDQVIKKYSLKDRKTAVTYRGVFERKLGIRK